MIRLAIALVVLACSAQAQSVKFHDNEITALLTGNKVIGHWVGASYRQYSGPNGITVYALKIAPSRRGEWRVANGEFQSIWPGEQDWEGWFVMEYVGKFFWVSKTTPATLFGILDGERLLLE